jgi:hypothetical protein
LSGKRVVLDCGETLEIRQIDCGGGSSTSYLKKQALIEAKWDPSNESYVPKSGQVFSVRGMPTQFKNEIERVRIPGMIDKKAAELEEALKKQRSSERIILGYLFIWLAAIYATFIWALSIQQPLAILLPVLVMILLFLSSERFAIRYAPWSGFLAFEDLLFIRIKHAIDELDRFLVNGRSEFLKEAVKLLNVQSLPGRTTRRRPISRVVQLVENEVRGLTQNIACRIAPHVGRSSDPKTFSQLVLGRLRDLLPILAKPDVTAIASWNEAVRNEFPAFESRAPLTSLGRALVSRPRILKVLTMAGLLLAGYIMGAMILFGFKSILDAHVLQASDFLTLLRGEYFSTYLVISTALASLLAFVSLRK